MIATILTIIAYLFPIIIEAVKAQKEKSKGRDHEANIQEFRKGLAKGDGDNISAHLADQHDRVQQAVRGS